MGGKKKKQEQSAMSDVNDQETVTNFRERCKTDRRLNWRQACFVLHCGRTKFFDLIQKGALKWEGVGVYGHYVWESDCVKLLQTAGEK